jgi:L-threonylcarbamoyladenylate synthase
VTPVAPPVDPLVQAAAAALRRGELVAFPTETVYGLGADARSPAAVAKVFAAKGRPATHPLIVHVRDLQAARPLARAWPEAALRLAARFWPGPLTLVLRRGNGVPPAVTGGQDTVALRVPAHPVAQAVLAAAGRPIAAPSANRSGRISATSAGHALADLEGRIDAVLDAGPTAVGVESTIVACLDGSPRLLRPGGVPRAAIEQVLGRPLIVAGEAGHGPIAPGMLASHYAPAARMRLDADGPREGEAWLGFGPEAREHPASLNLSPTGDLSEAAANLFGAMRRLDETGCGVIAVAPIPDEGLGEAINDRLRRAAAPR